MKKRTIQQNRALHKWFGMVAEALNDAGYTVQKTLRHDIEIPWTPVLIKELIYRPVMEAMTEKHSTTELDRIEPSQIYEVLNLHLGEKLGIHVDFPCEETQYSEKKETIYEHRNVGSCLNCGHALTRCGAPFDLEVVCPKCGRVNVYKNSNKPIYVA